MFKSLLTAISLTLALTATAAIPASSSVQRTPSKFVRMTSPRKAAPASKVAPEGEWKSLGKGTWHEELFYFYSIYGISWPVEIEESVSTPGYYRLIPYCEGSELATMLGEADNTYFYINATDPEKVYNDGDFEPYGGAFIFSHCVVENDWEFSDEAEGAEAQAEEIPDYYGKLADGVITFPAESFCEYDEGTDEYEAGWYTANPNSFAIELPADAESSIDEISAEAVAPKAVYDLQGRRMAAPARGINIINGKKFLVK